MIWFNEPAVFTNGMALLLVIGVALAAASFITILIHMK